MPQSVMQKSICAGFNKFSAANYLPPCFPAAFFIFQFQVQLNFFPRLLNGCCCPILNPFFPPNVPTGCCAEIQLSQPAFSASSTAHCTLHTAHCTLQIAQMHTAELHGMQASVAGQCRLILVLHCTVVLIISVLVVWVMAEQLNFPKNIARQSSSLSPNNSLVISSSPWAGSYK